MLDDGAVHLNEEDGFCEPPWLWKDDQEDEGCLVSGGCGQTTKSPQLLTAPIASGVSECYCSRLTLRKEALFRNEDWPSLVHPAQLGQA